MKHKVLVGITYPDKNGKSKRAEVGDVVSDIPPASLPWLLEQGIVVAVVTKTDKE